MPLLRGRGEGGIATISERDLSEADISMRLREAYRPGAIHAADDYAILSGEKPLRPAAVLVPFTLVDKAWHLVFTRRTETVVHHKGQVSFPGGACDGEDRQAEDAALREAWEEIGLKREDVRLLGRLNDIVTITGYRVTPVVGVMPWPYPLKPEPEEVGRVFTIPVGWLAERKNWHEQPFTPGGAKRPIPVVIYEEYDGEVLWGASARIMLELLEVLGL